MTSVWESILSTNIKHWQDITCLVLFTWNSIKHAEEISYINWCVQGWTLVMPNYMTGVKEQEERHRHQQCCVWVLHNLRELVFIAANFIWLNHIQHEFFIYLLFFPNLCVKWLHTVIQLPSTIFHVKNENDIEGYWGPNVYFYQGSFMYLSKIFFAITTVSFFQCFLIQNNSAEIWIIA